MTTGLCICTAADAAFAGLAASLVRSVRRASAVPIVVLDVGLGDADRAAFAHLGCQVAAARDDLPAAAALAMPGWFRAMTARPFLPSYAPGHDRLLWIDADAWVQDWRALEAAVGALADGRIALVREVSRGGIDLRWSVDGRDAEYRSTPAMVAGMIARSWHEAFPGDAVAAARFGTFNSGLLAMDAGASLWTAWQRQLAAGLDALAARVAAGETPVAAKLVEQTALNRALMDDPGAIAELPPLFNWCCQLGLPEWDEATSRFVDPASGAAIAVLHLVDLKVMARTPIRCRSSGAWILKGLHCPV